MASAEIRRFNSRGFREYAARTVMGLPLLLSSHIQDPTPSLALNSVTLPGVASSYRPSHTSEELRIVDVRETPIELPTNEEINNPESSLTNEQIQNELAEILKKLDQNPKLPSVLKRGFEKRHFVEDLKIYYPIYRRVALAYEIPTMLLFSQHLIETGASRKINNSLYVGAMQRDPRPGYWPDEFANEAFYGKGLEDLAKVPGQRHPTDAREIAAGAKILRIKIDSKGSIYGALKAYGAAADYRFNVYNALSQTLE
ncbi:MAG: hypothetical protein WD992_03385 [Candidatus Levyibacteriota bacterium]